MSTKEGAAEVAVEQERALVALLVAGRRYEALGRDEVEAAGEDHWGAVVYGD